MPRVTLMLPTYPGGEKYLEETLESLKEQTFTDYKLTVVNDSRHDIPKYNEALDTCDTEYLGCPHHDDIYGPTWLEEMVKKLDEVPQACAAFCLDKLINSEGRRIPHDGWEELPIEEKPAYDFKDIINGMARNGNFLRCETVLYRPKAVGSVRYDTTGRFGPAADTALWFDLLNNAGPIAIVNKQLVEYRHHTAQASNMQRGGHSQEHWTVMRWALGLQPDVVDWEFYIDTIRKCDINDMVKEKERVDEKKKDSKVRFVVVHEGPDNAGTGVVAAHRVRNYNKVDGEIAYYVFPDPNATSMLDGFMGGCPVIGFPPKLFQNAINRWKPEVIEYHHTLIWGDDILKCDTVGRKELYLHDRWMWSKQPHVGGATRSVDIPGGITIYANSPFLQAEAQEALNREVGLFDPFVPLPNATMKFRKRIGFFGYFSTTKGVHILLQAARKLPDVLFVLFIKTPDVITDGRRIYGHPNVLVMGAFARADLHMLVNLVDTVVVPSLFESYGLVKKEIESLGVPVISTKTGGMEGTIPPGDLQALVEAIG